jgi:hypothetical protein
MIAKGNTHADGKKLARYLTTAKEGERTELWELRGFASCDLTEAFRSANLMAEATRCEQPFMHVQIRNRDGEELTREQWRHVADRIESKLGLTDQPRAICFHVDKTGHEHMHIAWSRIDGETMTAVPMPFFKKRLKEVSRELEQTLGLTPVANERDGSVPAPTRDEFEQARRLGVDIRMVRQTIRDCWEHSDSGRSFEAALADQGFVLAQGDRRAFVVVDHEGGLHALGKRILGVTAGQIRARLSDLDREELPTIELARNLTAERQIDMRDPRREEIAWQDALAKAAIEKEKIERRFVPLEPDSMGGRAGGPSNLFEPPKMDLPPTLNRTSPEFWFEDVARQVGRDKRPLEPPEGLRGVAAQIWIDYNRSHNPGSFVEALSERGISLAVVTKEEAARSHRESEFARETGRFAPTYFENEIVAVSPAAQVYRLSQRTTGDKIADIDRFLRPLDRRSLKGIDETKQLMHERGEERDTVARLSSLLHPVVPRRRSSSQRERSLEGDIDVVDPLGTPARAAGKVVDAVASLFEDLFAPKMTVEEKEEAAELARERAQETTEKVDLSNNLADREQSGQRQEQERETGHRRHRDERDR